MFILIERRVDRAGLRNELMQLERQDGIALARVLQPLIRNADPLQELFQEVTAHCLWLSGTIHSRTIMMYRWYHDDNVAITRKDDKEHTANIPSDNSARFSDMQLFK